MTAREPWCDARERLSGYASPHLSPWKERTPPSTADVAALLGYAATLERELLDTLRYLREERRVRGASLASVTRRIVELERASHSQSVPRP